MHQRIQFTTRRLLLATAVLAVWATVLVKGNQRLRSIESFPPEFQWAAGVGIFVISTLFLAWLAAVIVLALGKKSILAACFGATVYVALIGYLSWAGWL